MLSKIFERHQPVIRLFSEFEHRKYDWNGPLLVYVSFRCTFKHGADLPPREKSCAQAQGFIKKSVCFLPKERYNLAKRALIAYRTDLALKSHAIKPEVFSKQREAGGDVYIPAEAGMGEPGMASSNRVRECM